MLEPVENRLDELELSEFLEGDEVEFDVLDTTWTSFCLTTTDELDPTVLPSEYLALLPLVAITRSPGLSSSPADSLITLLPRIATTVPLVDVTVGVVAFATETPTRSAPADMTKYNLEKSISKPP